MLAKICQAEVEGFCSQQAALDGNDLMRPEVSETKVSIAAAVEPDALAVVKLVRGTNGWRYQGSRIFERRLAGRLQQFNQDLLLDRMLVLVAGMLQVATAAVPVVRAGRGDALGRGAADFEDITKPIAVFLPGQCKADDFSWQAVADEHVSAVRQPAETEAAIYHLFYCDNRGIIVVHV